MQYTLQQLLRKVHRSWMSRQGDPLWVNSAATLPDLKGLGVPSCKVVFLLNGRLTVGCYSLLLGGQHATFIGDYKVLIANIPTAVTHWQHYDVYMAKTAPNGLLYPTSTPLAV
jgi:hypothetical protein